MTANTQTTAVDEDEVTDASAFIDALKKNQTIEDTRSPMEQALVRAIAALNEIKYCAYVGSSNLCHIEAVDALNAIEELKVEFTPIPVEPEVEGGPNIVVFTNE